MAKSFSLNLWAFALLFTVLVLPSSAQNNLDSIPEGLNTPKDSIIENNAYGFFDDEEVEEFKSLDQLKASMFLNECLNTLTRIIRSKNKVVLQEEQNRLDNIWEWKDAVQFDAVIDFRKDLQDKLNKLSQNQTERERYQAAFERKKNAAGRNAILNALSAPQVNLSPFALIANMAVSSARAFIDYNKQKDDLAQELDDQLWSIEKSDLDYFAELRQQSIDLYAEAFKDYDLENSMGLKIKEIEHFYDILDIKDEKLKVQSMLDEQRTFQYFAPYWFERGNAYISLFEKTKRQADLEQAFVCFDRYKDMSSRCELYRYDQRLGMISLFELIHSKSLTYIEKERLLRSILWNIRTDGNVRLFASTYYITKMNNLDKGLNVMRSILDKDVSAHNETILAASLYWDSFKNNDLKELFCKKVEETKGIDVTAYIAFMLKIKEDTSQYSSNAFYRLSKLLRNNFILNPSEFKKNSIQALELITSSNNLFNIDKQSLTVILENRPIKFGKRVEDKEYSDVFSIHFADESKYFSDRDELKKIIMKVNFFKHHEGHIDKCGLISRVMLDHTPYFYLSSAKDLKSIFPYCTDYIPNSPKDQVHVKRWDRKDKLEGQYNKLHKKYSVEKIDYIFQKSEQQIPNSKEEYGFEATYTFKVSIPNNPDDAEDKRFTTTLCFTADKLSADHTDTRLQGVIYNNQFIQF